jgi:TPR repeat protein
MSAAPARFLVPILALTAPAGAQSVDPRLDEAARWYTGVAGRVDDERAQALLLEAAAGGDPVSQMWLARCHSTGRMGFPRDADRARSIAGAVIASVRELAARGVAEAVFLMGTAFDEGLGETENPVTAASWYRRAADLGHVLAQHNLANLYFDGRGVRQDDRQAVEWWRRAAEQGDAVPMLRLGTMYEEGRGVARDLDQAREWYRRAAARGNARAAEALERIRKPGPP